MLKQGERTRVACVNSPAHSMDIDFHRHWTFLASSAGSHLRQGKRTRWWQDSAQTGDELRFSTWLHVQTNIQTGTGDWQVEVRWSKCSGTANTGCDWSASACHHSTSRLHPVVWAGLLVVEELYSRECGWQGKVRDWFAWNHRTGHNQAHGTLVGCKHAASTRDREKRRLEERESQLCTNDEVLSTGWAVPRHGDGRQYLRGTAAGQGSPVKLEAE